MTRSERLYRLLLRLFPAAFRDRFESDLLDLFRDKHRAAAARGPLVFAGFWARIVRDVLISAIAERFRPSTSSLPRGPLLRGFSQDVRYALRMIARRPTLSTVIILTLTLGIGANTAIFSLVNTVLLRRGPYRDADRLVRVWEQNPERGEENIRPVIPANFFDWKERSASFEDVAWSRDGVFTLTGVGDPESITGYRFSANMLDVLGVQPALGRGFRPEEDRPGGPRVVLLSDKLWKRRFGGDRGILGRAITLNGQSTTVVGVMPPDFKHPQRADLWVPIALSPALASNRNAAILRLVGRLRPGIERARAEAELASIYRELADRRSDSNKTLSVRLTKFGDTGDAKPLLLILFAGVGFILLIACANVANLLLADAASRRRELAVRGALGATRYRVARQMLTESLILSLAGGLLGALITWWTREGLLVLFPSNIANLNLPLVERIDVGAGVFFFAFSISVVAGLVFGSLPAWTAGRPNLQGALREGDRSGTASRRTHSVLVVAEVALSIVMLAGALLMVQSFMRVQRLQFGFDTQHVLSGRVMLPANRYADGGRIAAFARELEQRLRTIPGVESVGLVNYLPLSGWYGAVEFNIEGRPRAAGEQPPDGGYQVASVDYFRTMGISVRAGRTFTPRDDANAPRVVVLSEKVAQRYWPGENPVGRRIITGSASDRRTYEIVGVVSDVKAFGLEEPAPGDLYFPLAQTPSQLLCIALRTAGDPGTFANQLRRAVWNVDREQPVMFVMPMSELAAESLAFRRAGMLLAGGFGLLALVLAAIGIYGVLSYSVSRRTREIGVRVALGATRSEVAKLVVRDGLLMTAVGIALGLAAALALSRFMISVLYEVKPGDPLTYAAVAAILLVVALLATLIPARRATSVDPLVALRAE